MKKLLATMLAFALLLALLPTATIMANAATDGIYTYTVSNGEATITGCDTSASGAIAIPTALDGYPVTRIDTMAFYGCRKLTSISIPATVSTIGSAAFGDCRELTGFSVSADNAAYSNDGRGVLFDKEQTFLLQAPGAISGDYEIPGSVTGIGAEAFMYCSNLQNITIGDNVTTIGWAAFSSCSSLQTAVIGEKVAFIYAEAFYECRVLHSVYFLGAAPQIGYRVFQMTDFQSGDSINIENMVIYYIIGKDGWSSPAWNFYATSTWGGPQHTHSYATVVTPPTCTEAGCTTYTCSCGNSYTGNYVKMLGHAWDAGTITTAPTATGDGIKTFTCTRCNATKTEAIPATGEWKNPFTDVPTGKWYTGAVEFAVTNMLFAGTSDYTFSPDGNMTRAMLVTVLWRLDGKTAPAGTNPFSDVPAKQWYSDAVIWASENGVVGGIGNGKFDPNGNVTREQMAAILYRYAGKKGYDTTKRANLSDYPDGSMTSPWAKDALSWANAENLISGSSQGGKVYLLPTGNASRAQVAAILMRYVNNIVNAK